MGEVARIAHKLKGSSAVMGAARLATLCQELETRADAGDADLEALVARVAPEYTHVVEALRRLIAEGFPIATPPAENPTPADPQADEAPVLEHTVREELCGLARDDPARLARFIATFTDTMAERTRLLIDAHASNDLAALSAVAAQIRSGSGFVGAGRLAAACAHLEDALPHATHNALTVHVAEVLEEYDRVQQALEALRDTTSA